MNSEQATDLVKDILTGIVPDADFRAITPGTDFRQALELDSLDFLSFVDQLSERTGYRLEEDDYDQLTTLDGSVNLLMQRAASSG